MLAKLAGDTKYEIYDILDISLPDARDVIHYKVASRPTHPRYTLWRDTPWNYMTIAEYVLLPFASLGF